MRQFTGTGIRLTMLFFAWALLARAEGRAEGPIELVLSADMPTEKLVYTWDARGKNVVYMVHHGWGDAFFDISIFEDLLVPAPDWPTQHFFNNRRIDVDRFEWTREGDDLLFHINQQELVNFTMSGRVHAEANRVTIEGDISNLTLLNWTADSGGGLMCIRCRSNFDFRDLTGERIFAFEPNGRRHTIDELQGHDSIYFYLPLTGNPPLYQNRLRKVNQPGTREVTGETEPCVSLGGNRQNEICCIHPNVKLVAKPGQTVHWRTTVTFDEITPDGANEWYFYE